MLKVVGLGSCLPRPNLPPYDNNVKNVMMLVVASMIDDGTCSGLRCIFGSHSCSCSRVWLLYVLGLGGHGCWLQLEHWMRHLPENSLGCFWSRCGFIVCVCVHVCAGLFLGSLCVLGGQPYFFCLRWCGLWRRFGFDAVKDVISSPPSVSTEFLLREWLDFI